MQKLEPIFGFDVNYDENGNIEVNDVCNYPQLSNECISLFYQLEYLKIKDSGILFPCRILHWVITINPINEQTIKDYFQIGGIKKVCQEHKNKLIGKITFVKPELHYPSMTKYPNLHIHFYELSDDDGVVIIDDFDMVESFFITYNTNQLTNNRIEELEKLVNVAELQQMPFLPMEMVRFDDNGDIKDFEQHLFALSVV